MLNFLFHHTPLLYLTQSFWRDEAFSVLLSERGLMSYFRVTFEPPLYYIFLHYWMKVFGESEIAVRSLSLVGYMLACLLVIQWSERIFRHHWLSWIFPIFFFFNPMLLYYAFEARSYAWYVFFIILSLSSYLERKWGKFIISGILGFYTHIYMITVIMVEVLHYILSNKIKFRAFKVALLMRDRFMQSICCILFAIMPWLIKVCVDLARLNKSWYFPINIQVLRSVIGNIFVGFDGTPSSLWSITALLSLILCLFFFWAIRNRQRRNYIGLFFLTAFIPLMTTMGISLVKPVFVNRYVIASTVAEVFLVIFAIETIRNPVLQKISVVLALAFIVGFNIWYPDKHAKLDIRSSILEVNTLLTPQDYIYADSPLIFFDSIYYSKDRSRVFFYEPKGTSFPWYVGDYIVNNSQIVSELPQYPSRAFLIKEDGSYTISYQTNMINHRL